MRVQDHDWPEPRPLPWRLLARMDWLIGFSRVAGSRLDAIVLYHSVGGVSGTEYQWDLPVDQFEAQIRTLANRFEIVDLATLVETQRSDRKRVAITFDDAFRNVYEHAVPLLQELDLPATVFACPDYIGDANNRRLRDRHEMHAGATDIVMTGSQIRDLVADGRFTIGNHTRSHPDLTTLSTEGLRDEIVGAKTRLEERFGISVDRFSYPYGTIGERGAAIVAETHDLAVTSCPSLVEKLPDRYHLPRLDACQPAPVLCFEMTDLSARLRSTVRRVR